MKKRMALVVWQRMSLQKFNRRSLANIKRPKNKRLLLKKKVKKTLLVLSRRNQVREKALLKRLLHEKNSSTH